MMSKLPYTGVFTSGRVAYAVRRSKRCPVNVTRAYVCAGYCTLTVLSGSVRREISSSRGSPLAALGASSAMKHSFQP